MGVRDANADPACDCLVAVAHAGGWAARCDVRNENVSE